MGEQTFDNRCYDYGEMLDELRCHSTESVELARVEAVAEQRWWHLRELAATCVLDERGAVDDSQAAKDGTRTRAVMRKRATAKNLAKQPNLARATANGRLSEEQLHHASDLAGEDPDEDERWANDAPDWSPDDLARKVREQRKPTAEDGAARRAARELKFWWRPDHGMLDGRFSLPDIDGAVFESVINDIIERTRTAKGQPWETREHRGADALVELCRSHVARRSDDATSAPAPHLIVQVPLHGPATIAGIPLPDTMPLARLRPACRSRGPPRLAQLLGRQRRDLEPRRGVLAPPPSARPARPVVAAGESEQSGRTVPPESRRSPQACPAGGRPGSRRFARSVTGVGVTPMRIAATARRRCT